MGALNEAQAQFDTVQGGATEQLQQSSNLSADGNSREAKSKAP